MSSRHFIQLSVLFALITGLATAPVDPCYNNEENCNIVKDKMMKQFLYGIFCGFEKAIIELKNRPKRSVLQCSVERNLNGEALQMTHSEQTLANKIISYFSSWFSG